MREPDEFDGRRDEDEEGESDEFDEVMSDEEEVEHDEEEGLIDEEEEVEPDEPDEMPADEEEGEQEVEDDDQPLLPFIPNGHAIIPREGPDDPLPVIWVEPETFGKGWLFLFAFTVVLILGTVAYFIYSAIWGDGLKREGYRRYHIDF